VTEAAARSGAEAAASAEAEEVARLEAAVQRTPAGGEAWALLGDAYALAGQSELAALALREAVRLQPRDAWIWYRLSSAADADDPAALAAARRAVELEPGVPIFLTNLGGHLLRAGRPRDARPYLEEAARRQPESHHAAGLLGVALFRSDDFAGARGALEESLRREPNDAVLWAYLGVSLDETGSAEAATWALETALFAKPDYGWAWGRLGKALRALGRLDAADMARTLRARLRRLRAECRAAVAAPGGESAAPESTAALTS